VVIEEIGRGFELKRIWEERVSRVTGYSNFWKFLGKRYSWLMKKTVTLREFEPGTHCEVDWAGSRIPWWDHRGQRREAHVFLGILCHSQLIFAWASADERKHNWIAAHQKMYSFFGGVPRVTVPDNLKSGVSKAHLYDPELNPGYSEMGRHYHTAIVPARVRRPTPDSRPLDGNDSRHSRSRTFGRCQSNPLKTLSGER
jgi:transposase